MAKIKAVWLPVPAEGMNLDVEGAHVADVYYFEEG